MDPRRSAVPSPGINRCCRQSLCNSRSGRLSGRSFISLDPCAKIGASFDGKLSTLVAPSRNAFSQRISPAKGNPLRAAPSLDQCRRERPILRHFDKVLRSQAFARNCSRVTLTDRVTWRGRLGMEMSHSVSLERRLVQTAHAADQ